MSSQSKVDPNASALNEKLEITLQRYPITLRDVVSYIRGKRTPARILQDRIVTGLLPSLLGRVIELGAIRTHNNKIFATQATDYQVSNLPGTDRNIHQDITRMVLGDASVDSFAAFSVLEHVENSRLAVEEMHRT